MSGLVYELMDTLDKQIVHFDELIALSTEKKDLIVNNDTSRLAAVTSAENAAVTKIQKLDKGRSAIMGDIANVLGQSSDITLTKLTELLKGQPEYERIFSLSELTRERLEKLKALNDQNKILVDSSLEYINFTINAIRTSVLPEQAIYSPEGEELGTRQSFFDAKQ